ncbi:MAG: DUF4276 family protein [Acidimicrobiia bacterium]|nr:DUF4276 family protein [Acidimicrobiia bacterium]MBP8180068.1 DUF4276 family protein [Acidimicrobiia bacterium]
MERCRLLVEGQTEEAFAQQILRPHLFGLAFQDVTVTIVATKRPASGRKHRGGITSWSKLRTDIVNLTRDEGAIVTTLVDFYGLPQDVPGMGTLDLSSDPYDQVTAIEGAIAEDVGRHNLIPNLLLHELEALLYSDPVQVGAHFDDDGVVKAMEQDLAECGSPELVNQSRDGAPSKRITRHRPGYVKTVDGPAILADLGLDLIRNRCKHFDSWLTKIEALSPRRRTSGGRSE